MRVWLFNHYAVPPNLFPLWRPYYFAKFLQKKGYEVNIFAASSVHSSDKNLISAGEKQAYKVMDVDGIKHVLIKTRSYKSNGLDRIYNMLQFYFKLFNVVKNFEKPDVILATSVHPLTCVAGIKIAKKLGCPCIIEIADLWPETLVQFGRIAPGGLTARTLYALEKWIYKKADRIIFTMEGGKDYIADRGWDKASGGPVDLIKVHYINNGIDLQEFDYNQKHYVLDDEDLKNSDTFKVVYVGSIRLANDVGFLLDVAKILKKTGEKDIKFLIWGAGDELTKLKQRVIAENLDNVIFKGRVDKKYIPNILSQADLGALNYIKVPGIHKYGGSQNKFFDYLAAGKPIISNVQMGYCNITKYHCGKSTSAAPDKFADVIRHFYNLPQAEYEQYCVNARKAAYDFDFERLTDKLIEIIKNL